MCRHEIGVVTCRLSRVMDVRCEKCQTEYELDEARLKPGGVTVKCTNCGHMFKIRKRSNTNVGAPPAKEPQPAPPAAAAPPARARPASSKSPTVGHDDDTSVDTAAAGERLWL